MNKPSSDIDTITYHEGSHTLFVTFLRGRRAYEYRDVPADVYAAFQAAPSKGKFFHEHIKDKYDYLPMENKETSSGH